VIRIHTRPEHTVSTVSVHHNDHDRAHELICSALFARG
jgi:hypothetical protein